MGFPLSFDKNTDELLKDTALLDTVGKQAYFLLTLWVPLDPLTPLGLSLPLTLLDLSDLSLPLTLLDLLGLSLPFNLLAPSDLLGRLRD